MTRPPQPPNSPLDLRPTPPQQPDARPRTHRLIDRRLQLGLGAGLILIALSGIFWLWQNTTAPRVPRDIAKQALFAIYMPSKLPSGYKINPDSYESRQGVLMFSAQNNKKGHINFSLQARPQSYDFSALYERSLKDTRKVPNTPYPAFIGKAENNTTMLSIEADRTWLIITTRTPNTEQDLEFIAKHLVKR